MPPIHRKEGVMPKTGKVYPEWVQKYRKQGTTVKKKGNAYYLYKRTSKRVPGKKYPQPVDTYIGVITPEGVVESGKKKLSLSDIEVYEYGFSHSVWALCPESWKKPLGNDWEDVLRIIISRYSPETYLRRDNSIKKETDFRYQFPSQIAALKRRLSMEQKIEFEDLMLLKTVYAVIIENKTVISKISEEQKRLIERLSLDMGVE